MSSRFFLTAVLVSVAATTACKPTPRGSGLTPYDDDQPGTGTFSIIAYDSASGMWGGAVQSRVFSVGNGVLNAEAGVGVVASQAIVDVSYGPKAMAELRKGKSAAEVLKTVMDNDTDICAQQVKAPPRGGTGDSVTRNLCGYPKRGRQFAVVDAKGNVAAFTGPGASTWAGDKQGKSVTAQGNILAGPGVVDSMIARFERTAGQHLALRLVAALEGGQAAGGDTRGQQSAALIVVKKCGGVWLHNDQVLRLQVDDHMEPIAELRRLVQRGLPGARGVTNATNDPECR